MKHSLGTLIAFCITLIATAQYTVKGRIVNEQSNAAIETATVTLEKDGRNVSSTITDNNGKYEFKGLKKKGLYRLLVEHVSLQKRTVTVDVTTDVNTADVTLATNAYFLEPLEVRSLRASEKKTSCLEN